MKDETRLAVASLNDKTVNELRAMYEELFDDITGMSYNGFTFFRLGRKTQ